MKSSFKLKMVLLMSTLFIHIVALAQVTSAATTTAVGLWQSFDNNTGAPRAEIRITESQGVLTGRIERNLLPQTAGAVQVCGKCTDDRKGTPLIGMALVRNAKAGTDAGVWEGGEILDPDEGKTYRLRLQLLEDGKTLQVRGYIGPFFKNRTWVRVG
jgi:uncharacterized protein (DUF2147 family)